MSDNNSLTRTQRLLIGHGAVLVFIGGVLGFGFLFFLIDKIALWPIPGEIEIKLPGTYDAWRMAHMEGIINGLFLWLTAALLPVMPFSEIALKRIAYGMIVVGWTIVVACGPLTNYIAFFLFYVGVVAVMVIMAVIAYRCLKPGSDDD